MPKSDGAKNQDPKQPELELRPWYFPDPDITIMAVDREAADKELAERLETLKTLKESHDDDGA